MMPLSQDVARNVWAFVRDSVKNYLAAQFLIAINKALE